MGEFDEFLPTIPRSNRVNPELLDRFDQMDREFFAQTGEHLRVTDSFRTYDEQADLKRRKPNLAAAPGKSRHETGNALDVDQGQINKYGLDNWKELLAKHGFTLPVLSKGETWHIEQGKPESMLAKVGKWLGPSEAEAAETGGGMFAEFLPKEAKVGGMFDEFMEVKQPQEPLPSSPEIEAAAGLGTLISQPAPVKPFAEFLGERPDATAKTFEMFAGAPETPPEVAKVVEQYKNLPEIKGEPGLPLDATTETLRQFSGPAGEMVGEALNVPFIPLNMALKAVSDKALRPVMDYAFPKATDAEKEMVQWGFENVGFIGLAPTYLRLLGKGAQILGEVGKKGFYRYAPDIFFKNGKAGYPVPLGVDEIQSRLMEMSGPERAEMARKYPQFRDVLDEMTAKPEVPPGEPPAAAGPTAPQGPEPTPPAAPIIPPEYPDLKVPGLPAPELAKTPAKTPEIEPEMAKVPPPAPAKEPWEMTRGEFVDKWLPEWQKVNKPEAAPLEPGRQTRDFTNRIKNDHKQAVSEALASGLPVPPEVLADYPDLAKQETPKAKAPVAAEPLKWDSWEQWQKARMWQYDRWKAETRPKFKAYEKLTLDELDRNEPPKPTAPEPKGPTYEGIKEAIQSRAERKGEHGIGDKETIKILLANYPTYDDFLEDLKGTRFTAEGYELSPAVKESIRALLIDNPGLSPWPLERPTPGGGFEPQLKSLSERFKKAAKDDSDWLAQYQEQRDILAKLENNQITLKQAIQEFGPSPGRYPYRTKTQLQKAFEETKKNWQEARTKYNSLSDKIEALKKKIAERQETTTPSPSGGTKGLYAPQPSPGNRYTGFIEDELDLEDVAEAAELKPEPITRESILNPLMRAMGVPLYHGHFKMRKALGFFRPPIEEIRLKKMSDLEVTAHEVAHLMVFRDPATLKPMYRKKDVRAEIKGVSYDQKKLEEGFAEFVRLWATQPAEAAAKCPVFLERFERYLDSSPYGPALRQAAAQMQEWFNQDALTRARSKTGDFGEKINNWLTDFPGAFRQAIIDDLYGIERAEQTVTGHISAMGPYILARNTRGIPAVVESAINYGAPQLTENRRIQMIDKNGNPNVKLERTPTGGQKAVDNPAYEPWGLKNILEPVKDDLENWGLYAYGRRAVQLKAQGRENLFTVAEIQAMLSLETPEFRKAFDDYQIFNKQVLDFAQDCGVIDPEKRKLWENNFYIPFYRIDKGIAGTGRGSKGIMHPVKRLRGGTANVADPIENIIKNTRLLISSAMVNRARQATANLLSNAPGGARFMAKIPKDNKAVYIDKEQLKKVFMQMIEEAYSGDENEVIRQDLEIAFDTGMDNFVRFWLFNQNPKGPEIVAVMRNGKPEFYEVADPLLFRAFSALPRQSRRSLVRDILTFPKRLAHATITSALGFMARNVTRDAFMAYVLSRSGFKPYLDSVRGIKSVITRDANYREWLANGGGWGTFYSEQSHAYEALEGFYRKHGIARKFVIDTPKKLYELLQQLGETFEEGTRLAVFRGYLAKGTGPVKGVFGSREDTTDFAMRGDSEVMGWLYDTVPFLKAGVVSVDRAYRGFAHGEAADRLSTALKAAMIALISMGLYALNRGNPLYDQLPDWDRDTNWHFFIPKLDALRELAQTGRLPDKPPEELYNHWRFPKPWEVGAMASIAERSLEGVLKSQPATAIKHSLRIIRELFRWNVTPQIVAPLADIYSNWLSFPDRPVETQAMQELAPWARSDITTSRTLRALGEKGLRKLPREMQVLSPAQIQVLIRGYTNAWGAMGLTIADQIFFDDIPSLRAEDYPVLGSFYRPEPARQSRYVVEFYEMLREATEARRTLREMDKTYRKDFGDDLVNTPENLTYKQMTKAGEHLRVINREMKDIQYAPDLPTVQKYAKDLMRDKNYAGKVQKIKSSEAWESLPKLKARLIDMWIQERNALAREVVKDVEAQRKGASQ